MGWELYGKKGEAENFMGKKVKPVKGETHKEATVQTLACLLKKKSLKS